jgi:hypothetical protein
MSGDRRDEDEDQDEAGEEREGEGRRQRKEHRPWAWAASSTVALLIGLVLAAAFPGAVSEARAFENAPFCEGRATEPPRCRERASGTVVGTRTLERRREDDHYIDVRVGENATFLPRVQPYAVEVEAADEVFEGLRPGDQVTLLFWGRRVARIEKEGLGAIETNESPKHDVAAVFVIGLVLPPWALWGLYVARRLRRQSGSWRKKAALPGGRTSAWRAAVLAAAIGASMGFVFGLSGGVLDLVGLVLLGVTGALFVMAVVGVVVGVAKAIRTLRS